MTRELFAIFIIGCYVILAIVIYFHLILRWWRERQNRRGVRIFSDVSEKGDRIQRKKQADCRLPLLHDDGDFDPMVKFPGLEVVDT